MNKSILNCTLDWKINNMDIPTDHQLISCKISDHNAPFIDKGRWAIPRYILDDTPIVQEIKTLGREIMENPRDPQVDLQQFISKTCDLTRNADKVKCRKMNSAIKKLEKAKKKCTKESEPTPRE